ncbi:conserved hypothetical protein [Roseibium sp. TrichSKD4]|uniref:hypothetical protein n=1 Tax=Roseibium sp. TrichSKD4 TaxID=744980 RepID=UPI0001E56B07|nr:hypothetical protein [Roseibium sp. TrichSKD4]EFO32597.1 conserved hypothetical protein [Roseibium sp. TrichSKD4]
MVDILDLVSQNAHTIGTGLRHTNSALDIVGKLKTLARKSKATPDPELESLVTSLANEVADAKLANLALKEQLIELKEAILNADNAQSKLGRYELCETPGGYTVYRLKEAHTNEEPLHYACPYCYADGRISILQGGLDFKQCFVCKTEPHFFFKPKRGPITFV